MFGFGPNIWLAEGPVVDGAAGFRFPTRMCIVRLADGGIWVHSPVALTDDLRAAVGQLGPVRHIVAPNALHYMFVSQWAAAFPQAQVWALSALRAKDGFAQAGDLGGGPAWAGQIDQVIFPNAITDEAVFFHRASRTAIFTDLLQQFDRGWFSGWRAIIARADRMEGAVPQVPRKFRLATRKRTAARLALGEITGWQAVRLTMAHGTPVGADADRVIASAFRWL